MSQAKSIWQHAIENAQDLMQMGHSVTSAAYKSAKMFCPNSDDVYSWTVQLIEEVVK